VAEKPPMPVETFIEEMDLDSNDYADGDNPGYFSGRWDPDTQSLRLRYDPDDDPEAGAAYRSTEHVFRLGAQASADGSTLGEAAYAGYFAACDGKSLISGAQLPSWDEQDPRIQAAWQAAADAVREAL
jgi:hypothetical protein